MAYYGHGGQGLGVFDNRRFNDCRTNPRCASSRRAILHPDQRSRARDRQSAVLEDVASQFADLFEELKKDRKSFEDIGISFEEKAFYDILKELCKKYDFTYPEDKLIELSKAVKIIVDNQAQFPDWNKRDDIKSALKVDLILILDKFGYPPVERDEVYVEIFEQAENFKKNQK